MPASRNRWKLLIFLALAISANVARLARAEGIDPPPTDEPPPAKDPDGADATPDVPQIEETWASSPNPATRFWHITSYLKGTPAEVKATLDTQVLEFDGKLVGVLADIAQNEREAQSQADEALAAARATLNYKAIQTQADAAKAELDAVRASGASVDQRMAASSKYNRLKAELDKLERQALAKTSAASLKAARDKLLAKADTYYARRTEALAWRRKLINAILLGQTIKGRMVPGETVGLVKDAHVERVNEDHSVLARFPLLVHQEIIGEKEGVKQIQGHVEEVHLLLHGLDDLQYLRPKQELTANQAFKVTSVQESDGRPTYVLEPFACDFNYLLATILKPPKLKAPPKGMTAATMPATTSPATQPKPDESTSRLPDSKNR